MISSEDYYESQRLDWDDIDQAAEEKLTEAYEELHNEIVMLMADGFAGRTGVMLPVVENGKVVFSFPFPSAVYEMLDNSYVFECMLSGNQERFHYACTKQFIDTYCSRLAEAAVESV